MKHLFLFSVVLMIALPPLVGAEAETRIECQYGVRAKYPGATIVYPDYAVRFVAKRDKQGTGPFHTDYVFVVLDRKDGRKRFYFKFVMAGVYDYPEIQIDGKRYLVEMFNTMSVDTVPFTVPRKVSGAMPEDEIMIWDEATARAKNPALHHYVWQTNRGRSPGSIPRRLVWK